MSYQSQRGGSLVLKDIPAPKQRPLTWPNPISAMKQSLAAEVELRKNLETMYEVAGKEKDSHLQDLLVELIKLQVGESKIQNGFKLPHSCRKKSPRPTGFAYKNINIR